MTLIAWLLFAAALLPYVAAVCAKAGAKGFDNNEPRAWLARQEGWRARANAAQANFFEGLPLFYAAVLFALLNQASTDYVAGLMLAWLAARLGYLWFYIAGRGTLRSLVWAVSIALDVAILLAGV